jgi:phage protein D
VIGIPDTTETVRPTVTLGALVGLPLNPLLEPFLLRTVVDTHVHLPDMFELTFVDEEGTVAEKGGFAIGQTVSISAGAPGSMSGTSLITGEITSIEAICDDGMTHTVIRGYEKAHRLQRAKRSRTFLNMKDSDIARQVAGDADLTIGTIDETQTTHDHLAQVVQTDWEFLTERAREVGYEVGVTGGEFFFRKASGSSSGGGLGGMIAAVASALGVGSGELTFKENLITFLPRISAANITPDVEVRVWDAKAARVAVGSAPAKSGTAKIDGQDPVALAKSFKGGIFPALPSLPAIPPIPGLPKIDFGTAPSNTAYVVVNRPMANGSAADTAASEAAVGLADHISSTFAEAEGYAVGDPAITAGATVKVKGVPKQFVGDWVVTNAKHILDAEEGGYHVRFYVSGRQDRSLLQLASGGSNQNRRGLGGLVCGIVTNAKDPDDKGRVKVALPWLAPNYESDWARVVQIGAGMLSGALFVPEVGDEVLIGFEFDDPRRPYVLGGLLNDNTTFDLGGSAISGGKVTKRGIVSPAGNKLIFADDLPPGPPGTAPPNTSQITLGSKDDAMGLVIDQAGGTITVTCKPKPPASKTPTGAVTIEVGEAGSITIKSGTGGNIKIEAGGTLELSGQLGVKLTSSANVDVKGALINLNS